MHTKFLLLITIFSFSFLIMFLSHSSFAGMVPYEKGNFTTIEGKIKSVYTTENKSISESGLHLILETSSGDYIVHVCPQWYADQQQFQFLKGELLTVSGSVFVHNQQNNIYAATINRRFSSLSKDEQIRIAFEASSTQDLQPIASKYAVDIEEVKRIKNRMERSMNEALFPEPLRLRNPDTGDGLWGGRFYRENMPFIRQKRQEEIRKKLRERKQGRFK